MSFLDQAQFEQLERFVLRWRRVLSFAADLCIFGAGVLAGLGFADFMGWLHV